MKTQLSSNNPFAQSFRLDHAFVWERIRSIASSRPTPIKILDYGAHDGRMLQACINSGLALDAYGVDANKSAIAKGLEQIPTGCSLHLGDVSDLESFVASAGGFDVVCLMGVLEHVRDQQALLKKLRNALKPGGTFVMSVPGKHFLSVMDIGNWKFYFPRTHRFFIRAVKGDEYYRAKFIECRNGLFGDIELGKNEHQHFARSELISLIERNGFKVETIDGYGFLYRLLHNLWLFTPKFAKGLWRPIIRFDLIVGSQAELILGAHRQA